MITFAFVEDYLEVLAGFREITDRGHSPGLSINFCINKASGPIALARYDVSVIYNMANSTVLGKSLTDKQADLAVRLIDKYKKQFASKSVNVAPTVQAPVFRMPLRTVDREKSIFIRDNQIILKFPYDKTLVNIVSSASKESKGSFKFDHDLKEWQMAITEYNVNWVTNLAHHGFTVDPELNKLMQLILDCEQQPYKIELTRTANDFLITNAEPELVNYVQNNIGGFGHDNLIKLVDFSGVLGYTVHQTIEDEIKRLNSNPIVLEFFLNKCCHYIRDDFTSNGYDVLHPLIEYASLSNRWPIYVHEPDSGHLHKSIKTLFAPSEILELTEKTISSLSNLTNIKCVYFKKIKTDSMPLIPVLLTTSGMVIGRDRLSWFSKSEKVVYYTATTYNKEIKQIGSNINN